MKKVLFLIHDLGPGGAEKVLVNLVNHMDRTKYDITVMSLFDVGVNRQFLAPHIRYRYCFRKMFRGNSHLMKLLSPRQLHKWLIKEHYDMEASYLEGPSARIVSGSTDPGTKTLGWIHCLSRPRGNVTLGFRSYREARDAYGRLDKVVCVSQTVKDGFCRVFPDADNTVVCYNTNDSAGIRRQSAESIDRVCNPGEFRMICVGKLIPVKALDRVLRIHKRLRSEGYDVYTDILGEGVLRPELEAQARQLKVADSVSFLGYQTNPYKYVASSDLLVCSSFSEGFSTAATEALIVGTPVCTVEVSGMKEMLGENNEYGIVTENSEEALYRAIKKLLDDPALLEHYRKQAKVRGRDFSTERTVEAVEQMLESMMECAL